MDAREFLQAVVPWVADGYATIHWQLPGKKAFFGRSFRRLDEALAFVSELHAQGNANVYFCVSRQRFGDGKRSRAGALLIQLVAFDLDIAIGDPNKYQRPAEAIAAVLRFYMELGIPKPSFMVMSGGGIHCYWLSNKPLAIEDWQPFADALKNAARLAGLLIDGVVTGDAARVLRLPGGMNHKYTPPQPVRILEKYSTCEPYDFSVIFAELLKLAPASQPAALFKLGPLPAAFRNVPLIPLGRGIEGPPPPSWPAIKAQCGWLRQAYESGGEKYDQPQWNLTTLTATFLENGHELAHKFANRHPEYNHGETENLWERKNRERRVQNLGWPSCRTISDNGSQHCRVCPHFKSNKSPLNLGYGVTDDATHQSQESPQASPQDPQQEEREEDDRRHEELGQIGGRRPVEARLPEGFCFDAEGRLCAFIASIVEHKKQIPSRLEVLIKSQILRSPVLHYHNGELSVSFIVKTDRDSEREVILSNTEMHHSEKLCLALTGQDVCYNTDAKVKSMLVQFTSSWIDLLRQEDSALRDSSSMGWRYEEGVKTGFAYGNVLYHADGSEQPLLAIGEDEFRKWYLPVGRKEVWLQACRLLTARKRPELDILIAVGFAAPLMSFTGALYGSILSVWGDPGSSKSTAQQVAAAIWGHPKQTRESLNSTPKSVQKRLGLTRNLAGFWDDVQDQRHQENLFQTVFVTAEGTEGGRLNSDTSMRERLDWQTLLVACSNASFIEFLVKKQRSTTAGMRRVFEFEFNRGEHESGMIDALDASKVFGQLEFNYGTVGAEYAKLLVTKHQQIEGLVDKTIKRFKAIVGGSEAESYWWSLCGVLLVGAMLARQLGADLDVRAMDIFLQDAFLKNRKTRGSEGTDGGSLTNTEHSLSAFLNLHVSGGHALYVARMFEHRFLAMNLVHQPIEGRQVTVQFASNENRLFISKRELRRYLQKEEIQPRQVFDGLIKYFGAKEIKVTLGGGTQYAQTQEICFEIPVPPDPNHVLHEILVSKGAPRMSVA